MLPVYYVVYERTVKICASCCKRFSAEMEAHVLDFGAEDGSTCTVRRNSSASPLSVCASHLCLFVSVSLSSWALLEHDSISFQVRRGVRSTSRHARSAVIATTGRSNSILVSRSVHGLLRQLDARFFPRREFGANELWLVHTHTSPLSERYTSILTHNPT